MKHCLFWILCLWTALPLTAQKFAVSTNLLDWANLGTVNLQAGISASRHLTLHAGIRYNPWQYGSAEKGRVFQNKARTASVGARLWPWNVYSSWWFGLNLQCEEYRRGGLIAEKTEEGRAGGLGFAAGYSRMLSGHWNFDVGLGFWVGAARYTQYRCPRCGRTLTFADGTPIRNAWKGFIWPSNDVRIGLTYVF